MEKTEQMEQNRERNAKRANRPRYMVSTQKDNQEEK